MDSKEIKRLFQPSLDGVAQVMRDQLRMAQQKGCEVKVANMPSLSTSSTNLTCHTESYPHGRVWTIRILVRLFKGYIGKRVRTWGSEYRVGLVKITVGRASLRFVSVPFTNGSFQQIDRRCMWCRHSCSTERRRTCAHLAVQLRILADRALRHAGGPCKSETEAR